MDIERLSCDFELLCFSEIKHSGGILYYCQDDNTVLLTLRSKKMSSPKSWDIPGGSPKNSDKSSKDTAIREMKEELSIPITGKEIGKYLISVNEHRYDVYIYSVSLSQKENLNKNIRLDKENKEFKWFDINELPKKTHFNISWIPKELISII